MNFITPSPWRNRAGANIGQCTPPRRRFRYPCRRFSPGRCAPWAEPLAPALHKLLIPTEVMDSFENARQSGTGARFARRLLESLDIRFQLDDGDLERIPARSPAIIVANHPYGIVEGLILMALLDRVRQDLKILANSLLGGIPELREQMILVNPFQTPTAQVENRAPLRAALD